MVWTGMNRNTKPDVTINCKLYLGYIKKASIYIDGLDWNEFNIKTELKNSKR